MLQCHRREDNFKSKHSWRVLECENNERKERKCFALLVFILNFFCFLERTWSAPTSASSGYWIVAASSSSSLAFVVITHDDKVQKKWNCFSNSADCRLHLKCFVFPSCRLWVATGHRQRHTCNIHDSRTYSISYIYERCVWWESESHVLPTIRCFFCLSQSLIENWTDAECWCRYMLVRV